MGKLFFLCSRDGSAPASRVQPAEQAAATGRLARAGHQVNFNFEVWARDDAAAGECLKGFYEGYQRTRPSSCANVPGIELPSAVLAVLGICVPLPEGADTGTHDIIVRELKRVVRDEHGAAIIVAPPSVQWHIVASLNEHRFGGKQNLTQLQAGDLDVIAFGISVFDTTQLLTCGNDPTLYPRESGTIETAALAS